MRGKRKWGESSSRTWCENYSLKSVHVVSRHDYLQDEISWTPLQLECELLTGKGPCCVRDRTISCVDPHQNEALQSRQVWTKINWPRHPAEMHCTCFELEALNENVALLSVEWVILSNKKKRNSVSKLSIQAFCLQNTTISFYTVAGLCPTYFHHCLCTQSLENAYWKKLTCRSMGHLNLMVISLTYHTCPVELIKASVFESVMSSGSNARVSFSFLHQK